MPVFAVIAQFHGKRRQRRQKICCPHQMLHHWKIIPDYRNIRSFFFYNSLNRFDKIAAKSREQHRLGRQFSQGNTVLLQKTAAWRCRKINLIKKERHAKHITMLYFLRNHSSITFPLQQQPQCVFPAKPAGNLYIRIGKGKPRNCFCGPNMVLKAIPGLKFLPPRLF